MFIRPLSVVMIPVATIVAMTVPLGTIGMLGTTAIVRTATEMTGTVRIVTGTTAATAGNALGRLLAVVKSMIVGPPGLHLRGGMMIEGLQGTMIGGVAMMTGEALTLTMTAAGTTWTDAGTTAAGKRGTIATMIGLRGMPTGIAAGRAEVASHLVPDKGRAR